MLKNVPPNATVELDGERLPQTAGVEQPLKIAAARAGTS